MAQTLAGVLIHTRRENRSNQGEATVLNVTPERKRDCESLTMVVLASTSLTCWWRVVEARPETASRAGGGHELVLVEDGGLQRPCFNCFG